MDLSGDAIEVFRGPTPQGYARVTRAEVLEPEMLPGLRLRVDDMLG